MQTFVGRVMSLLFDTPSRFVIAFLPRSNRLVMAGITVRNDFRAPEEEICHCFHLFPSVCRAVMGPDTLILVFFNSFKLALSLSSFTLPKKLFSSSLLSAIRVISSTYLRLLMFLLPTLIPAYNSSSLAFLMMCSAYRFNKQGDSRQPCHSFFDLKPISCSIQGSTIASWPTYRFLRRQVRWSGIPISLRAFHSLSTVKGFSIVSETEIDVFLKFPCFLYNPLSVGNLISSFSNFSKPTLDWV